MCVCVCVCACVCVCVCMCVCVARVGVEVDVKKYPLSHAHSKNRIVILTSGWLFESQHITCVDTDWSRLVPLPTSTYLVMHLIICIGNAFYHSRPSLYPRM